MADKSSQLMLAALTRAAADPSHVPSALTASSNTRSRGFSFRASSRPSGDQRRIVPSSSPVSYDPPSGANTTRRTGTADSTAGAIGSQVSVSHRRLTLALSPPAATFTQRRLPSGLKA